MGLWARALRDHPNSGCVRVGDFSPDSPPEETDWGQHSENHTIQLEVEKAVSQSLTTLQIAHDDLALKMSAKYCGPCATKNIDQSWTKWTFFPCFPIATLSRHLIRLHVRKQVFPLRNKELNWADKESARLVVTDWNCCLGQVSVKP